MDQSDFERTAVTAEPVGQKQTEKKDGKKTVFMIAVPVLAGLALALFLLGRLVGLAGSGTSIMQFMEYSKYLSSRAVALEWIYEIVTVLTVSARTLLFIAAFVLTALTPLLCRKGKKPNAAGISWILAAGGAFVAVAQFLIRLGLVFATYGPSASFITEGVFQAFDLIEAILLLVCGVLFLLDKKPVFRTVPAFVAAGVFLGKTLFGVLSVAMQFAFGMIRWNVYSLVSNVLNTGAFFLFGLSTLALGLYFVLCKPENEAPAEEAPSEETPAEETV